MRETQSHPFEIKQLSESGSFSGYASIFRSIDNDSDIVLPGAFAESIAEHKTIKLLWQHDMAEPIGVITQLREDGYGLYVEGRLLLEVQRAREAHALLKSGAMNGLSIGYRVKQHRLDAQSGIRELLKLELLEISLVTFPSNEEALVMQVKSDELPSDIRSFERFLHRIGYSRSRAKEIALYGYKGGGAKHAGPAGDDGLDAALEYALWVLLKENTCHPE